MIYCEEISAINDEIEAHVFEFGGSQKLTAALNALRDIALASKSKGDAGPAWKQALAVRAEENEWRNELREKIAASLSADVGQRVSLVVEVGMPEGVSVTEVSDHIQDASRMAAASYHPTDPMRDISIQVQKMLKVTR